jgi:hypothetical protein
MKQGRTEMQVFYLVAAVAGTLLPYFYFGSFVADEGVNLSLFLKEVMEARASMGFVADLFISSFAFWPFLFSESKKWATPSLWIFLVLNLTVGLSCALPLFLFFRERRLSA